MKTIYREVDIHVREYVADEDESGGDSVVVKLTKLFAGERKGPRRARVIDVTPKPLAIGSVR